MIKDAQRRGAAMPADGYKRPAQLDHSGLVVTHVSEDGGKTSTYDFSQLQCAPELLSSLVQAFASCCEQGGRWKTPSSVRTNAKHLRRFIQDIAEMPNSPSSITEITPEFWRAWRSARESTTRRWPADILSIRTLLTESDGLPDSTRKAMRARVRKPRSRQFVAYSRSEFERIRTAAKAIVRAGNRRIQTNIATLNAYYAGEEPSDAPTGRIRGRRWTAGELLDHIARTGSAPTGIGGSGLYRAKSPILPNLDGATTINEAIFANSLEIAALSFLLVCEHGFNFSVISNITIDDIDRADDRAQDEPIHILHLDKPRRGPTARFSDETLVGDGSRVLDQALSMTDQVRRTLSLIGNPSRKLLVYRASTRSTTGGSVSPFCTELTPDPLYHRWHARTRLLADDGAPLKVNYQRLRLTEQVLNTKPRQNSPAVSEDIYRRPDPQTQENASGVIIEGQNDAIEHARATVAIRTLTSQDLADAQTDPEPLAARLGVTPEKLRLLLAGALNTATGACVDFTNSPFAESKGLPCPASFLACLGCANAVVTPQHIPRLVALSDALERTGSAVSRQVWDEDYAIHFMRLTDLLSANTTAEERDRARKQLLDEDVASVARLLERGLDA